MNELYISGMTRRTSKEWKIPRKMFLSGHRPMRVEIKYKMQHETLSNDLAPWHVSRCLRYGSRRIFSFLSVAPRKNQKKARARGREKGEGGDGRRAGLESARERERRRTNEGRITANVIFMPGPRRGQRGHQQTGDE